MIIKTDAEMATGNKENSEDQPFPLPTLDQDSSIPSIELEGYRFHCRVWGETNQDSILVLHGGPGADFRYLLPLKALSNRYRLIFYDQRGSGLSPRSPASRLNLPQYLRDLDAFVHQFGQKGPISLLGHSWGAHLALQYIARHPKKISSLVLAEPFIPSAGLSLKLLLHNVKHGIAGKAVSAFKEILQLPYTDAHARSDYFFGRLLQKSNPGYNCPGNNPTLPFWRSSSRAFVQLSFSPRSKRAEVNLKKIHFPSENILMLHGECNHLLGKKYQRKIQKQLQYPTIRPIPNAGHYLFTDNPAVCLQTIEEFISKAPSANS